MKKHRDNRETNKMKFGREKGERNEKTRRDKKEREQMERG